MATGETFDNTACFECPVQTKCKGGIFVDEIEDISNDVPAIMEQYTNVLREASFDDVKKFEIKAQQLADILKEAKKRQVETVVAGNLFLQKIIAANNPADEASRIGIIDIYDDAVDDFVAAPVDSYVIDLSAKTLDGIAESVLHYADIGICGAIEIERGA